jgi:alkylation response protein AidB-like acyl-CoA dehydrogenase
MYFKTTDAHEEFRQKVRKFAEEEVKPYAFMMDQNNEFPMEAVQKMAKLNLMGIPYPKEYGGSRAGCYELCNCSRGIVQSRRRYRCYPICTCIAGNVTDFCIWNRRTEAKISGTSCKG